MEELHSHFPSFQSSSNGFSIKYAGVTLSPHAMMMIYLTVLSDHSWIFFGILFHSAYKLPLDKISDQRTPKVKLPSQLQFIT